MNVKNEKSGAKHRIGITAVDVLILVIILAVGVFAYQIIFTSDTDTESYPIDYVIKVSAVRDELSDRVNIGDKVFLWEDNAEVGAVKAYEVTASVLPETGQTLPGLYDLYITVTAGSASSDRIYVSGHNITVEGEYSMRTNSFFFDGICISINK